MPEPRTQDGATDLRRWGGVNCCFLRFESGDCILVLLERFQRSQQRCRTGSGKMNAVQDAHGAGGGSGLELSSSCSLAEQLANRVL